MGSRHHGVGGTCHRGVSPASVGGAARILKEEGVLAQGESVPSVFASVWMQLRNRAGKPSAETDTAEIVQWPEAAWQRGLPS
jgi:hypothetical protein